MLNTNNLTISLVNLNVFGVNHHYTIPHIRVNKRYRVSKMMEMEQYHVGENLSGG